MDENVTNSNDFYPKDCVDIISIDPLFYREECSIHNKGIQRINTWIVW